VQCFGASSKIGVHSAVGHFKDFFSSSKRPSNYLKNNFDVIFQRYKNVVLYSKLKCGPDAKEAVKLDFNQIRGLKRLKFQYGPTNLLSWYPL
jgi:hypothetical protein